MPKAREFEEYTLPKLTEAELAYTAGILDGEGSIVIQEHYRRPNNPRCRIEIYNSNREMLDWMSEKFCKGLVRIKKSKSEWTKMTVYFWIVNPQKAVQTILIALLPFLIIKKEKAKKALSILEKHMGNADHGVRYLTGGVRQAVEDSGWRVFP